MALTRRELLIAGGALALGACEAAAMPARDWAVPAPRRAGGAGPRALRDLAPSLGRYGEVTRQDVAAVLLAVLGAENTVRRTYELLGGDVPVDEAVAAL